MVEQRGGSIDGDAARLLAQRCAGDLLAASNEVDKLLAYTAPLNSIFAADVRLVVVDSTEASVFTIVDAVCGKKAASTADLADRLLAANVAPEQILALVGSRVRDLVLLAAARRERIATQEAAHRAAWEPWRLGRVEPWLASYSNDDLAGAQSILVATDLALKSRPSHERPLVALLALLALAQRSDAKALKAAFAY
jgi:DNA polymerase-3 subunit delta